MENSKKSQKTKQPANNAKNNSSSNVSDSKQKTVAKTSHPFDALLWIIVIVALCAVVGLNYYFSQPESMQPLSIRLPFVIGGVILALVCALCTSTGRRIIKFAKSSRGELRKVTWPTKDETIKSTVGVAVVAVVVAFMLWIFDVIIGFLVNLFTGA